MTAPGGRGFHEKDGLVNAFFLLAFLKTSSPTIGRRLALLCFVFPYKERFFLLPRRHALLPFALLMGWFARCQLVSSILKTGAAISVPN